MVEVARRSGAPLHLSHLKVVGRADLVEPLLELLERARTSTSLSTSTLMGPAAPCCLLCCPLGHKKEILPIPWYAWQTRINAKLCSAISSGVCAAGKTCTRLAEPKA